MNFAADVSSGGKLASSFELCGSSLSLGTLSTPISEFKLTVFI